MKSFASLAVFCGIFLAFLNLSAQEKQNGELYFGLDFNSNLDGFDRSLPFWLHANQHGIYDQRSANGIA